jgi:hypothetical protein
MNVPGHARAGAGTDVHSKVDSFGVIYSAEMMLGFLRQKK